MAIAFPTIPLPFLPPLYYADIVPGQSPFSASLKMLLVGQRVSGAQGSVNKPYILSGTEAARLFGRGSMLAMMYAKARANAPFAEIWGVACANPVGGVAATGAIRVSTAPTATGQLILGIGGAGVIVPVKPGTAINQAIRIRNAINGNADLPVTAALDGGDNTRVVLTAKWPGYSGDDIVITKGGFGTEGSMSGLVTITPMSGGIGTAQTNAALASLGQHRVDVIASTARGIVSGSIVDDFMDGTSGRWSPLQQLYGHWFTAGYGTFAYHVTNGLQRNGAHRSHVGIAESPSPPWEWAAAVGAHATTHWAEPPELSRPLQTLHLKGIAAPLSLSSVFTTAENQALLAAGVSTWYVDDANDVRIQRLVTGRRLNDWGDEDASWRDAVTMFQTMYFARRMRQAVTNVFPRAALTTRDTGLPGFASPGAIRDLYIHEYKAMEALGLVENSDAFAEALIVERNATDPNRVDSLIKPDFVNQLRIVANLIETHLELERVNA